MRILFVHNYYQQRGGEDVVFEEEVKLLRENGYQVGTVEFTNEGFDGSIVGNLVGAIRSLYNSQSATRVEQAIDSFQPDIVHIHNLFYTASPSIIRVAKRRGIPVVMTLHNYRLVCASGFLMHENEIPCERCLTKTVPLDGIRFGCFRNSKIQSAQLTAITSLHKLTGIWQSVDQFIVLTDFAREKILQSSLRLSPSQISVKPNFIRRVTNNNSQYKTNAFTYVGRISKEKGIANLLEAFNKTNYKLNIAGDGPMKREVLEACEKNKNITYLGYLDKDNARKAIQESSALIFPSMWHETFGLTLIEAFSVGCPVIASKIGFPKELIKHKINGLHFQPGDVDDLIKQITYWNSLTSKEQNKYKLNAYETYLQKYTPDINKRYLEEIYSKIKKPIN